MTFSAIIANSVMQVVELVVTHPLVNILRGAMSILVAVVSHPHNASSNSSQPDAFGFNALKPAIAIYPQFLEMLVSRLSSADHALCANALQLINSLMREAITNDSEADWPKFIKLLQDLGVIKAVYAFLRSSALQDLTHPILEFQSLSKVLLRKWRNVPLDLERTEHRRALKCLHLASNPVSSAAPSITDDTDEPKRRHHPTKWRRLGFETESPAWEFEDTGYLGMMDLTYYVRKHEDAYQKLLLEQATKIWLDRCPVARASLAVTALLYEHFEIEKSDVDDAKSYLVLESRSNYEKIFKPLLLQWPTLHVCALNAFLRLWKATGAKQSDFIKIVELVRILLEAVVGAAPRTKDLKDIETDIEEFELSRLRQLQMELIELTYEDTWGHHLRQVKDELQHEALHFVKEQRIRCLLAGSWFPNNLQYKSPSNGGPVTKADLQPKVPSSYRFVRLSHNRRYLHYADFSAQGASEPEIDALTERLDLNSVSSVVSNVSTTSPRSSTETLQPDRQLSSTKITIHGYSSPTQPKSTSPSSHNRKESILLTLYPPSHSLASEWLDGLLMLLNQQPITKETTKLITLVANYGLKIRLLNVRFEDEAFVGQEPEMPSREGVDEEFWYADFGGS